jgi:hypothetical protein
MTPSPFRVLYREFLLRLVDRELLSAHANGDASQLLLQIAAILIFSSGVVSVPALFLDRPADPPALHVLSSSVAHFLIATTMLAVGVLAVLGWNAMFPDQRDVRVLAPLPVRAHTILLAKMSAMGTALALAVGALNLSTSVAWTLWFSGEGQPWVRLLAAYWATVFAAALFVFAAVAGVNGVAAALLPHRAFLRVSPAMQLAAFVGIVAVYFLQPTMVTWPALAAHGAATLGSPSYWFLGLYQFLGGAPAFEPIARRAAFALATAVWLAIGACWLAYRRVMRRLAEAPDLAVTALTARRLPPFGGVERTAIVHFSIRTLLRSAPHRVTFTFYLGIGFALAAVLLKSPGGQSAVGRAATDQWYLTSVPIIMSSVLLMTCAVIGARLTCALPRDLPANWIFRLLAPRGGTTLMAARRGSLMAVSVAPAWLLTAVVLFLWWPPLPAIGHLVVLGLLGAILVELCLWGTQKIPFACSYLPGKSRYQMFTYVAAVTLGPMTLPAAQTERDALLDAGRYTLFVGLMSLMWMAARLRTRWLADGVQAPDFEDEPTDRLVRIELWDSRVDREDTTR